MRKKIIKTLVYLAVALGKALVYLGGVAAVFVFIDILLIIFQLILELKIGDLFGCVTNGSSTFSSLICSGSNGLIQNIIEVVSSQIYFWTLFSLVLIFTLPLNPKLFVLLLVISFVLHLLKLTKKQYLLLALGLPLVAVLSVSIFYEIKYLKADYPRSGSGVISEISFACDRPYERCYAEIEYPIPVEKYKYQRIFFGDSHGMKSCNQWGSIPSDLKVGETVKFFARRSMSYNEFTPKNALSLCLDFTNNIYPSTLLDNKEYYIKRLD